MKIKSRPEDLNKYSALLLPNIALLSDEQCRQIARLCRVGGSLLATFETSLYDERNQRRADFGLADVFGIHKAGDIIGTNGNAYMARIEKRHADPGGLHGHQLDSRRGKPRAARAGGRPGSDCGARLSGVSARNSPIRRARKPMSRPWCCAKKATAAALFPRRRGAHHVALRPYRSGPALRNSIHWVAGANSPVTIEGEGVVEAFAWETEAGFAVHVLNYTNPAMHKGSLRTFYPIGAQKVRMRLPAGRRATRVELLRAEANVPFRVASGTIEFTVPKVVDYEVAAIYSA